MITVPPDLNTNILSSILSLIKDFTPLMILLMAPPIGFWIIESIIDAIAKKRDEPEPEEEAVLLHRSFLKVMKGRGIHTYEEE